MRKHSEVYELRLILYVRNFDTMRSFYRDTLGYPERTSWNRGPEHRGVMFEIGSAVLELMTSPVPTTLQGGIAASFGVADVWALRKKLGDHVNIDQELHDTPWGDTAFRIIDPEGFRLTFFTEHSRNDRRAEYRSETI